MSDRITPFEGIAGHLLRTNISASTFATGMILGLVIAVSAFVAVQSGSERIVMPIVDLVFALVLARFAVNGVAGEWKGTFFSTMGGSWIEAVRVMIRYVALSAVWLVPLLLLSPDNPMSMSSLEGSGRVLAVVAVLFFFVAALSPPVFLIVAASAERFADIVSPRHWKAAFGERLSDLLIVWVLYAGSMVVLAVFAVPFVLVSAIASVRLALVVAGVAMAFLLGFAITYLGRLCGFFILLGVDPDASTFQMPAGFRPAVPSPNPAAPRPAEQIPVHTSPERGVPPAPAVAATPSTTTAEPRKPPLMDAAARVADALSRLEADPGSAIRLLEELHRDYAPSPQVLHALTLARQNAGRLDDAMASGREGVQLCLARGNLRLAAEIYSVLIARAPEFGLNRDQTLAIAASLRETKDLRSAASIYGSIIRLDPSETRAVKGMLQVAQAQLASDGNPSEALRLYDFLLHYCGDSPLAEFMRTGREEAERRSK